MHNDAQLVGNRRCFGFSWSMRELALVAVFGILSLGCGIDEAAIDQSAEMSDDDLSEVSSAIEITGPIYYVAPNGDDQRTATQARNIATPWKTIRRAATSLAAGETVQVRAGTYAGGIRPANSGNATAGYITFMAYPGESVVLDATGTLNSGPPAWDGAFNITDRSYIQIVGFKIPASDGFGVFIQRSDHIRVIENAISHTHLSGIYAKLSDEIVIDRNDVGYANLSPNQESISLSSVTHFSVRNNVVHHGNREGIDVKNASSYGRIYGNTVHNITRVGIYIDGWGENQTNIDIFRNVVRDGNPNPSGAGEDGIRIGNEHGGREENMRIFNNVVYNARVGGIAIESWTHSGNKLATVFSNIKIFNNTVTGNGFNNTPKPSGWGIRISSPINISGLIVRNNIAVGNASGGIKDMPAGQIESNNLVTGDPKFVNAAGRDYRLAGGSPAIDRGYYFSGLKNDIALTPRPRGAAIDLGAYEY